MTTSEALDRIAPTGMFSVIRNNWMIALAVYPLVRFLLLAEPPDEMSGFQLAERFMWLSIWPIEFAIMLAAGTGGFGLGATLKSLISPAKIPVAVWFVALVWSSLSAPDSTAALLLAIEWLVHGYVAMAAWYLLSGSETSSDRQIDHFVRLAPWVTIIVGLLCMAMVYRIGLDSGYPFGTELPGFAHIRHTGYIFAPVMVLSIARIAANRRPSWPAILALTLNSALCLWFGSRGPIFGLICGLAVAFFLFADFRRPIAIARIGGAMAMGAVVSVVIPSPERSGFNAVMRLLNSSADPTAFSSGRLKFWEETLAFILNRPLFGYGSGQFQHIVPIADNMYRHPHDFVLQVIFDWGVLGGGAFLTLLGLALATGMRRCRGGGAYAQLGILGAASMLGFALLDGILFYPHTILITFVFLTLPFVDAKPHREGDGAISPRLSRV